MGAPVGRDFGRVQRDRSCGRTQYSRAHHDCKEKLDKCRLVTYKLCVIRSFRSKALKLFSVKGDASRLPVRNFARIARILAALNAAVLPEDMNLPGYRFHSLQGQQKRYAVDASGNYRVTYGWEGQDAIDVDLEDYH